MKNTHIKLLYILIIIPLMCFAGIDTARAQEQEQIRTVDIPKVSHPPRFEDFINGTPREAELVITDFRQIEPGDGEPLSQPTTDRKSVV